jgi:hypothetical protein
VPAADPVSGRVCRDHLRLMPDAGPVMPGQLALLDVPTVPVHLRAPYDSGEQQLCSDCVAADVPRPRLGLSERTAGDMTPLCLTCWRARMQRARRRPRRGLAPMESGQLAELVERLTCEACGQPSAPRVDLPPAAVEARRRWRKLQKARDRPEKPVLRRSACWRCEDAVWLATVRAVHEQDQAEAGRERELVDELAAEHRAALDGVARAERRLADTRGWRDRVQGVVDALPVLTKTGSRGRLQIVRGERRRARAWHLIADFLVRDDADRRARQLSHRGRPAAYPLVVAVMAVGADNRSGRRSMEGLHRTARFAGTTSRTVSTGWARSVVVGSTRRVAIGRSTTLAVRGATGRRRTRSVYDFRPPHLLGDVDATQWYGEAARLLARLLQIAEGLVVTEQAAVAEAQARADGVEARLLEARAVVAERTLADVLLQAAVAAPTDPDADPLQAAAALRWQEQAKQAADEAVAARGRADRAFLPPTDPRERVATQQAGLAAAVQAEARVAAAFETANRIRVFSTSPDRGQGGRSSSGSLWGFPYSAARTSPRTGGRRPDGRGASAKGGASRASTTGVAGAAASQRHRTLYAGSAGSRGQRRQPAHLWWTKPLAKLVAARLPVLARYLDDARTSPGQSDLVVARERGLRVRQIAMTLGAQLSEHWLDHPDDIVTLIERFGLAENASGLLAPGDAHSPLRYLKQTLRRALTNPDAIVRWPSPVRAAWEAERAAAAAAVEAARQAQLRAELDQRDEAASAERSGTGGGRAAALAIAATARGPQPQRAVAWPPAALPGSGLTAGPRGR